MGVNTGMSQALLGNNPLATIQGVWESEIGLFIAGDFFGGGGT